MEKRKVQWVADLHAYGGLGLAAAGVGWLWHPGAGLALLGLGLLGLFALSVRWRPQR